MRVVFDENTPKAVAHAMRILAVADAAGSPEPLEVLHALDLVAGATQDVPLIQAVADGHHARSALITCDKSMRTRTHERAAFSETGCIGIVLRANWNHAPMWDRARLTLIWWQIWVGTIAAAPPGSLWQSPWSQSPKPLKTF